MIFRGLLRCLMNGRGASNLGVIDLTLFFCAIHTVRLWTTERYAETHSSPSPLSAVSMSAQPTRVTQQSQQGLTLDLLDLKRMPSATTP